MYRRILVPLDGSLQAEQALSVAVRIARASAGTIILLRVVKAMPEHQQERDNASSLYQAMGLSEWEEAHQYLVGIATSRQMAGLSVMVSVRQGLFLESLQATIKTYQADLLICCEKAEQRRASAWPGSFAEQLSRHIALPLLLMPACEPLRGSLALKHRSIICEVAGVDSHPDPHLIAPAAALLAAFASQQSGHLHYVSLSTIAEYFAHQPVLAEKPQMGAVLLQEASPIGVVAHERWVPDIFVLETPFPPEYEDVFRGMRASPCLLVPAHLSSERVSGT